MADKLMGNYLAACGKQYKPGQSIDIYVGCTCEMDTFPQTELQANPASVDYVDKIRLSSPLVFSTVEVGKGYFRKIKAKVDSVGFITEGVGEAPTIRMINKLSFTLEGMGAEAIAYHDLLLGMSGSALLLTKSIDSDDYTVIGTYEQPAKVTSYAGNGGKVYSDPAEAIFEVSANGTPHFYDADTHGIDVVPVV